MMNQTSINKGMVTLRKIGIWIGILCVSLLLSCSHSTTDDHKEDAQPIGVIKKKIDQTSYGEEIGFQLKSPIYKNNEISSSFTVEGEISSADQLEQDFIWVVISGNTGDPFEYYIPIDNGKFKQQLTVHQGKGEYDISMRAASNKSEEADMYYDVASFTVENTDSEVKQDIIYTKYGLQYDFQIEEPINGVNEADESIYLEGTVGEDYEGNAVLISVEKDYEFEQITFPVIDGTFSGDVPLYYGLGDHRISVQLYNPEDEFYYESAVLYADNQTEASFAYMETFIEAGMYGIVLDSPTYTNKEQRDEEAFEVAGTIDTSIEQADEITHVIAKIFSVEENEEASYIFPVVDGAFSGNAYFRFGPGEYDLQIMIPDITRPDEDVQYFQTIANAQFSVEGIEDQRNLLPSQGIESDHVSIQERAEQITEGITDERERARAVYAFVAQHVAYDVEKYQTENSFTRLYDSALEALDSGKGVCQDYAYLAIALLRSLGMEAHYVVGQAGELHAWVEVMVDGEWIEMDPTWGAGYVVDDEFTFHYDERYFDPDPNFFAETHTREEVKY